MTKLKVWQEEEWDAGIASAAKTAPLKKLASLPNMPGITPETARFLTLKSLYWMIKKDADHKILKNVLKRPFTHAFRYFKSLLTPLKRDGDFFFYGISSLDEFERLLAKNPLFVIGFSYCHKPFECPSGRFTDQCLHDPDNPVCRQCFIGKAVNMLPPQDTVPLFIPTIHYIGEKIFELIHKYPDREIAFLITACEMTLTMFGDWGNLAGIKGIGVRLDGRICNTMKAFELSEEGIKPGLTVVLPETQRKILDIIKHKGTKESH